MATEVKIADFKAHLSEHLRAVRSGGEIVIKDRETPVARVVPYGPTAKRLSVVPPTRTLKEIDQLPFFRPKRLKRGDADKALQWVRRDRF